MRHTALRLYSLDEANPKTGYPRAWEEGDLAIKHQVRADAGDRCVRCHHPYRKGDGEWSACDERCTHYGPVEDADGKQIWFTGLEVAGEFAKRGPVRAQWRVLTVHHLISKLDCRWFAMVALCQRCHLQIQGKVVMDRAFIFEHSDWFKPYAAGWYAWKYEGREIAREEAEERMDELLAYERLA